MSRVTRILVIDNYDSFVHNIAQYLAQLGADVELWRNDDPRFSAVDWAEGYDGVLISPGPGAPESAGVSVDVIRQLAGKKPVFGVCLGLQSMAVAFGATVDRASEQLHGKVSEVFHDGAGVFRGLPSPIEVTRYHSLAVVEDTVPPELEVTARTQSGVVMAMKHRDMLIEAVQFHPESVLTQGGYQMLANWLGDCGNDDAPGKAEGMSPLMSVDQGVASSVGS